jgi:hypothetical protein
MKAISHLHLLAIFIETFNPRTPQQHPALAKLIIIVPQPQTGFLN